MHYRHFRVAQTFGSLLRRAYCACSLLLAGCATGTQPFHPIISPIELDGPQCSAGEPAVEVLRAHAYRCGKGDQCAILDLHIQNPTKRALWMLIDARALFSGSLSSIHILHANHGNSPPVWEFIGDSYNQAFALPPGADLVLRNLHYSHPLLKEFHVALFNHLILNHDRYIDSGGKITEAITPAHGDFDMSWLNGADSRLERPLISLDGEERVSLDTWCVQTIPITYQTLSQRD